MNDFAPEVRNAAMWSGDARRMADGRAVDVYLTKLGEKPIEDISGLENVQWGLHLQDTIGRVAGDRLDVRLKDADYALQHPKHDWMRSHFDFISEDGKQLVEVKNYNASKRNQFGDNGSQDIPAADFAQILHEATVHRVDRITLAVLFGGQELCLYPFTFGEELKEALIQQEAELWGRIQAKNPPMPQDVEDARALFKVDNGQTLIAPPNVVAACRKLKQIKSNIKVLEEEESILSGQICSFMQDAAALKDADGNALATWKKASDSKKFDSARFKAEMPKVYEQYMTTISGSRRFLVK